MRFNPASSVSTSRPSPCSRPTSALRIWHARVSCSRASRPELTTSICATSRASAGRSSPPSAASWWSSGRAGTAGSPTRARPAMLRTSRCSTARRGATCPSMPRPTSWPSADASTARPTRRRTSSNTTALDLRFEPLRAWISGRANLRVRARSYGSIVDPQAGGRVRRRRRAVAGVRLPAHAPRGRPEQRHRQPAVRRCRRDACITLEVRVQRPARAAGPQSRSHRRRGAGRTRTRRPSTSCSCREPRFMYSNRVYWYPQSPAGRLRDRHHAADGAVRVSAGRQRDVRAGRRSRPCRPGRAEPSRATNARSSTGPIDRSAISRCVISRFVPIGRLRVAGVAAAAAALAWATGPGDAGRPPAGASTWRCSPRRARPGGLATCRHTWPRCCAFYATTVGEAPYPDFTLATLDDNLPGGHSPAYFAVLHQPLPTTPFSWRATRSPSRASRTSSWRTRSRTSGGVRPSGWKNYHEQWISEGFAQYFAVALRRSGPRPGYGAQPDAADARVGPSTSPTRARSALGYRLGHIQGDSRAFRAVVYNKSAVVLHMLRRLMGDEAFFRGVRRFYVASRFRKVGTDDFRAAFQAETPVDLDRFFEQWMIRDRRCRGCASPRAVEGADGHGSCRATGRHVRLPRTVTVHYADGRSEYRDAARSAEAVSEHRVPLAGPRAAHRDSRQPVTRNGCSNESARYSRSQVRGTAGTQGTPGPQVRQLLGARHPRPAAPGTWAPSTRRTRTRAPRHPVPAVPGDLTPGMQFPVLWKPSR